MVPIIDAKLFDYIVEEFCIIYISKKRFINKKDKHKRYFGLIMYRILKYDNIKMILARLEENRAIFSISIQTRIKNKKIEQFLLLKIREGEYYNFLRQKSMIKEKLAIYEGNFLKILVKDELESIYLSILQLDLMKSDKNNMEISRKGEKYFLKNINDKNNLIYFYLISISCSEILNTKNSIFSLAEIMLSANIPGSFVLTIYNSNLEYKYNSYFITTTNSVSSLTQSLQKILFFRFSPKNKFHPNFLGKILTREEIFKKESLNTHQQELSALCYPENGNISDKYTLSRIPIKEEIKIKNKKEVDFQQLSNKVIRMLKTIDQSINIQIIPNKLMINHDFLVIYFMEKLCEKNLFELMKLINPNISNCIVYFHSHEDKELFLRKLSLNIQKSNKLKFVSSIKDLIIQTQMFIMKEVPFLKKTGSLNSQVQINAQTEI